MFRWQNTTRLSVSPRTVFTGTFCVCVFACVCVKASSSAIKDEACQYLGGLLIRDSKTGTFI